MKNDKRGFTLVELIAVIAILVIVAGIFTVNMIKTLNRNKEAENENTVKEIVSAADAYVSANPEAVQKLYEGYGYVDIPVGVLRDAGLLDETIKDSETGEVVPDSSIVRVKIETGDKITAEWIKEADDLEAYQLEAQSLYIDFDSSYEGNWCDDDSNVFKGLYVNPDGSASYDVDYVNEESQLYIIDNSNSGQKYKTPRDDKIDLQKTSCNVNPRVAGKYNITYSFNDPSLGTVKTKNRTVYVLASTQDVIKFEVTLNENKDIVQGWGTDVYPNTIVYATITEYYKGGEYKTFQVNISDKERDDYIENYGYVIRNYSSDDVVDDAKAIITKIYPNSDGTTPKQVEAEYTIIPNTYTITFDAGQGSLTNEKDATREVKYLSKYGTLPSVSRVGYTFDYWYILDGDKEVKITAETVMDRLYEHSLIAHYTPNIYTVTFDPNGGTTSIATEKVTFDSPYGVLPEPARTGYTFDGWYTEKDGGENVVANTRVTTPSDHTLYAHWTANTYTVTFNANGGSISSGQTTKTVTYDDTYGVLPTASGRGSYYYFSSWCTATSGGTCVSSSSIVSIASDHVLYARWRYSPPAVSSTTTSYNPGTTSGTSASSSTSTSVSSSCDYICQMKINSSQWQAADAETRKALHAANVELAKQGGLTESNNFTSSGYWLDNNGNLLYGSWGQSKT